MSDDEIDPIVRRAEARVGQVLRDKWRIDRLLGIGGMAAVYEGTHRNGKRGAIKMLHVELSLDADARRRFLREGYAANRVEHEGAVSVLDDDTAEDGSVFLVMELLEGQSVDAMAEAQPASRLDLATTVSVADQVLDVLAAAHDKGIVHRDLKPENLFMKRDGRVKILDFGLARVHEHAPGANATRTGNAMGTPAYMAPEQALGNWADVDARTDLWAVGATMFTLLTGRLVHQAATLQQLMLAAMTKPAPPLRSIDASIPASIASVVDRALAFDRDARFPDARAMQRALRDATRGMTLTVALPEAAEPRVALVSAPSLLGATVAIAPKGQPGRAAIAVAAAGLALGVAAAAWVILPKLRAPEPVVVAPRTTTAAAERPVVTATETSANIVAPSPSVNPPIQAEPTVHGATESPTAAPSSAAPRPLTKTTPRPAKSAAPAGSADPFGAWR